MKQPAFVMAFDEEKIHARIREVAQTEVELEADIANDVAFHLTDWLDDLERLYRFYSEPHSLTDGEVQELLFGFLIHVPNHLAAASKLLTGVPVTDIFEVGATTESEDEATDVD